MKPANVSRILIFTSVLLIIASCSKEQIPQDVLVKTYVENIIIEEKYSGNLDSLKHHQKLVFQKNNITKKDFEEALKHRIDDQEAWEDFFKQANLYLDSLKKTRKID